MQPDTIQMPGMRNEAKDARLSMKTFCWIVRRHAFWMVPLQKVYLKLHKPCVRLSCCSSSGSQSVLSVARRSVWCENDPAHLFCSSPWFINKAGLCWKMAYKDDLSHQTNGWDDGWMFTLKLVRIYYLYDWYLNLYPVLERGGGNVKLWETCSN